MVGVAEAGLLEGFADQAGGGRDHRLEQREGFPAAILKLRHHSLKAIALQQLVEHREFPPKGEHIIHPQHRFRSSGDDRILMADMHQVGIAQGAQFRRLDAPADQGGVGSNAHLKKIVFQIILQCRGLGAVRQQTVPDQHKVNNGAHRRRQSHPGEVEHPQPLMAGGLHQAGDQQVGRGADQRGHASDDRGVGERDHQLGGGDAAAFAPGLQPGDQHRDDRGVVEKRRH